MCHFTGKRAAMMNPIAASAAWHFLAAEVEAMGDLDVPKFSARAIATCSCSAVKHSQFLRHNMPTDWERKEWKREWARRNPGKVREANRRWRAGRQTHTNAQAAARMKRMRARRKAQHAHDVRLRALEVFRGNISATPIT